MGGTLTVYPAVLLMFVTGCAAQTGLTGRVVGVSDGDTITVLDAGKTQHKIRIDGIDAPESGQPFGQRAKESLSGLAFGKDADAHCPKTDRYGRRVCRVLVDGVDVGLEQIRRGMAWHFKRYEREQSAQDRAAYAQAEQEARAGRAGLWRDAGPLPPWEWRAASAGRQSAPRGQ
jgi:endonuclease YncB( thermonuclease family)